MKKRLLCLGLLLIMAFSFAACGGKDDNATKEPPYGDEQEDNTAKQPTDEPIDDEQEDITTKKPTFEEPVVDEQAVAEFVKNFNRYNTEFVDNQLLVLLTEEASFEYIFHDYTAEDFPGIGAISVSPLDGPWGDVPGQVMRIRQYLLEDPSGSTIPDHLKHHKRSFCITLDKHDEENVLRAVYILSQRADIYLADPNWLLSGDV